MIFLTLFLFSNVQDINLLGTHLFKNLKIPAANERWFAGRGNNSYVSIARSSTSKKSVQDLASMDFVFCATDDQNCSFSSLGLISSD